MDPFIIVIAIIVSLIAAIMANNYIYAKSGVNIFAILLQVMHWIPSVGILGAIVAGA